MRSGRRVNFSLGKRTNIFRILGMGVSPIKER
jgi:hypothetical protein